MFAVFVDFVNALIPSWRNFGSISAPLGLTRTRWWTFLAPLWVPSWPYIGAVVLVGLGGLRETQRIPKVQTFVEI